MISVDRLRHVDVTFRESANLRRPPVQIDDILTVLEALATTPIDFFEVAYASDHERPQATELLLDKALKMASLSGRLAVMAHPNTASIVALHRLPVERLGLVRIACDYQDAASFTDIVLPLACRGVHVALNLARSHDYSTKDCVRFASEAFAAGANVVYLADTDGQYVPDDVKRRVSSIADKVPIDIGLHAHNHMGMASANALAAVSTGARWVDVSMGGIGKGGNLPCERWFSLMSKLPGGADLARQFFGAVAPGSDSIYKHLPAPMSPEEDLLFAIYATGGVTLAEDAVLQARSVSTGVPLLTLALEAALTSAASSV